MSATEVRFCLKYGVVYRVFWTATSYSASSLSSVLTSAVSPDVRDSDGMAFRAGNFEALAA